MKETKTMMDVPKEMKTTYADCGDNDSGQRRLTWHADQTVLLAHAAEVYGCIENYNEFHPGIVKDLACAFKDKGIEVICGRESSVVMYLLVPKDIADDVFLFARDEMSADEVDFVDKIWSEADDARYIGDSKLLRIWWD